MTALRHSEYEFSEDYSPRNLGQKVDFSIDTIQYDIKDFDFWDKQTLDRSVKRHVNARHHSENIFEQIEDDLPMNSLLDEDRVVFNLPSVFTRRILGERSVNTLQEWECVVQHVEDEIVYAKGVSLLDDNDERQVLEIPTREFSEVDRKALASGTVFRLIVGFVKKASGTQKRESFCYVRRKLISTGRIEDSLLNLFNE
jgi:hypothetical protein